ncbi:MMPL family transporter [Bacillaceae bacterium S4-13-58]
MRGIIKGKWFIVLAWIAVTAVLVTTAPNMANLVSEKGELEVPEGYSSTLASEILAEVQDGEETTVALVFHEEDGKALDMAMVEEAIQRLEDNKDKLGIASITTHFDQAELEGQLVTEDKDTVLASISIDIQERDPKEVSELLYAEIEDIDVAHYYTSNWMINEDLNENAQEGLKRTEGITVVFILIVLLLVFRSFVAPFVPLLTIGLTYLASQSVVAFLVDQFNFPISSYTQIFLVAILFGIGTDYCILLLSRFKEEMGNHESLTDAIVETYRTAGKTVFYSGLAVMTGFAAIGFSQFKLYQSASAVAIGIALLLLALTTIVPFFMAVLGKKLFWPTRGKIEHKESKFWDTLGRFSIARPLLALLIVGAITIPFLATYDGELSYNSLNEMGDDVASVKAFNIISDGFGPGESMPTQVIIKNDEEMDSSEYIVLAEEISNELAKINGVDVVRSVTRPTGEILDDLFVSSQAEQLKDGITEANNGVKEISDGLHEASSEMKKSEPQLEEAVDGIEQLVTGTNELKEGIVQLQGGLSEIEQGLRDSSLGAAEASKGLAEIKSNFEKLVAGSRELLTGYKEAQAGLGQLYGKYVEVGDGVQQLSDGLKQANQYFTALENNPNYEGIEQDQYYQGLKGTVQGVQQQLAGLAQGLTELNANLNGVSNGIAQANTSFENDILANQELLVAGMGELLTGLDQLQSGLEQMAAGQGKAVDNIPSITDGVEEINGGQKELLDGFSGLGDQMSELTGGLTDAADGLDQIYEGLEEATTYLSGIADSQNIGIYVPEETFETEEFQELLDHYLSDNKKVMTMDLIFSENPYSSEAMDQIEPIKETISRVTKDTKLENAQVAVGGITSINKDLATMSDKDYSRTVVLMLIGITLILVILLKSMIMPIYLIGSLIITYYTSMAISEFIFVNIVGYDGLSWVVSFFAFVILIALGIDYSIFLMDRFNEYRGKPVLEAMLVSMRKMGTVIISAAIILGGTFVAMMPSGVLSLLQIATIVLVGLILYAMVVLPLFIPVMVKIFGKANWWPFVDKKKPTSVDRGNTLDQ